MKHKILFILLLSLSFLQAQELNCNVTVDYSKVPNANPQLFKNLEKSISDFVNKNSWTEREYKPEERISCSMYITINAYENNNYETTLQVQSTRPVYNATYTTPVLNINDKDFSFQYIEFQQMYFNPNSFDSNLLSTLAFYCNLIIGVDADTFSNLGGNEGLENAQEIANIAMPSGIKGWSQTEKTQNKYFLINDMFSPTFKPFREAQYQYHFLGMDKMNINTKESKEAIINAVNSITKIQNVRPNAYLTRIFFDAKADEIVTIFSEGPTVDVTSLLENLNRVSPTNSVKWEKIKK
ncbi:DUF4835 family protein [Flavobacterium croceum]|uniref:Uncharacterized protein DUF4835 n=1 Tax=Flavobacterium croceum DSM 17960 TaxID=1121886 RepID=A0A2S4NAZ3_9FLAO|nr:DUF4835 family protein [Flavobacterium croceum]POS02869.1 uncharacterized protein DUF4835 [Flavobacterium croceum DSM 17960]